jgi:hypothetical protein
VDHIEIVRESFSVRRSLFEAAKDHAVFAGVFLNPTPTLGGLDEIVFG